MQKILLVPSLFLLLACDVGYQEENIPTTPEERIKVQETVNAQLAKAFPNGLSLAGHDQEYYTLVSKLNEEARKNLVRTTQWELQGSANGACRTGRWRYMGESTWRNEAIK